MDFFGLDVNPRTSWPTVEQWAELQPGWVRFKHFSINETKNALATVPPWTGVILLVDGETENVGSDLSGFLGVVQEINDEIPGSIDILECINEPDTFNISPETVIRCTAEARNILVSSGTRVIVGGVTGPNWPDYIQQCAQLVPYYGIVDGFGFHPYGQNPDGFTIPWGGFGSVREKIEWIYRVTGLPVYLTETGCKIKDGNGADGVAQYLTAMVDTIATIDRATCALACWFCLDDAMGSPGETGENAFGLTNDEEKRPAYYAFKEATSRYPKG